MATKLSNDNFDELKMGENYFYFHQAQKQAMKTLLINDNSLLNVYILIEKYLMQPCYSLTENEIHSLMKNHLICLLYAAIFENKNYQQSNEINYDKNQFIKNYIDYKKDTRYVKYLSDFNEIVDYKNNTGPFYSLLSNDNIKKTNKYLTEIAKIALQSSLASSVTKGIEYASRMFYNYFSTRTPLTDVSKLNRFDLIIAHQINNPDYNEKFTFYIENDEINKILWTNKKKLAIDFKKCLLGFIINQIFKEDNLDFSKEMHFKDEIYYKTMVGNADSPISINNFDFILSNKNSNTKSNIKSIKKENITEFYFTYNNKEYLFSKNGIIQKN